MLTVQSSDMNQAELAVVKQERMDNWESMNAIYEMYSMMEKTASGLFKNTQITPTKNLKGSCKCYYAVAKS